MPAAGGNSARCPKCLAQGATVTDTRNRGMARRRRRRCPACENRWTTVEIDIAIMKQMWRVIKSMQAAKAAIDEAQAALAEMRLGELQFDDETEQEKPHAC